MEKQKRTFPYQIHIALGIMWILIGLLIMSGIESIFWMSAGLMFIVIGFLARREKLRKQPLSTK